MAKKLERKQLEMEFLSERDLLKADRRIADREATLAALRAEIGNEYSQLAAKGVNTAVIRLLRRYSKKSAAAARDFKKQLDHYWELKGLGMEEANPVQKKRGRPPKPKAIEEESDTRLRVVEFQEEVA